MRSNLEWKKWGEVDPLFGVATWKGKSKNDLTPWTDSEFYALGESDWSDFIAQWVRYGVEKQTCLEIGCGAGRLTRAMVSTFQDVYAVDVSNKMIEYARAHVDRTKVTLFQTNGVVLPFQEGSINAVFSAHVFQHFDSLADASLCFSEIYRVLEHGSSFMIHLPVYRWPAVPRIIPFIYRVQKAVGLVRAEYNRFRLRHNAWRPFMRGLWFDIDWLHKELRSIGFSRIEVDFLWTRSNDSLHPFVFGVKERKGDSIRRA